MNPDASGPRPPSPPPPQPPRPPGPGRPSAGPTFLLAASAAVAVISTAAILMPLAMRVWTSEITPASNRVHFGDGLVVALALAGLALYLFTSVLFVHRRPISPAGMTPRWVHRLRAMVSGYFWLPCPRCARPFGGHEVIFPDFEIVVHPAEPRPVLCPRCTRDQEAADLARFPALIRASRRGVTPGGAA